MIKKINIVITVKKKTNNLKNLLISISNQTVLPFEVIISTCEKFSLKKMNFDLKIIKSPIQNQVYQRQLAIKNFKKKNNILLQLDERCVLDKNAIKYLQIKWSESKNTYYGIGLNAHNNLDRGVLDKITNFLNLKGKILKVGINTGYQNIQKDIEVDWLSGGSSSWKIDKNFLNSKKNIFLKNDWSVGEDIIQSLNKPKGKKIIVCYKAKATFTERSTKQLNQINFFERGKSSIIFRKELSKLQNCNFFIFYLFNLPLILTSLLYNLIFFNSKKLKYTMGQLIRLI